MPIPERGLRAGLVLLLILLGGCAARTPAPAPDDVASRQGLMAGLSEFEIRGRLGVRSPAESGSASLRWQQRADRFDLRLAGPLGFGGLRATGSDGDWTLTLRDGRSVGGAEAAAWFESTFGEALAPQLLRSWLFGVPHTPGARFTDGAAFEELGWQLSFERFRVVGGTLLPHRIRAVNGDFQLTLAISSWEMP